MTSATEASQGPHSFPSRRGASGRALRWLRVNLFASISSSIISLLLILLLAKTLFGFAQWGIWNAVWSVPGNNTSACRAAHGLGACWAVIPEKYRFILFGTYPYGEQWRPA